MRDLPVVTTLLFNLHYLARTMLSTFVKEPCLNERKDSNGETDAGNRDEKDMSQISNICEVHTGRRKIDSFAN